MEVILIIFFILIIVLISVIRAAQINQNKILNVFDGLFFGGIFFILIPIIYTLIYGKIVNNDFSRHYIFSIEESVSSIIYALFSLNIFGILTLIVSKKKRKSKIIVVKKSEKTLFIFVFFLYILSELIFFIATGKLEGNAHWFDSNKAVFERGAIFVLLSQFHNVGRIIIPAMLMYFQLFSNSKKILKIHVFSSLFIIIFELMLTGNRIAILFILISFLIPFLIQKRISLLIRMSIICLPLVLIAQIWPMVRGMMWTQSFSLTHFENVIKLAYNNKNENPNNNINALLTLTEAHNLIFLDYVYKTYPEDNNYLFGETLILKSFGTLIPKSIWTTKPDGLSTRVGAEVGLGINLALNTTILGDAWANFGYGGIFIIILILYVIHKIYNFRNQSYFYSFLLFMIAIASWRFDFSFYFVFMFAFEIMLLLIRISFVKQIFNRIENKVF